jgi:solute carrier family 25 phosphate transporter 23/24/25/41
MGPAFRGILAEGGVAGFWRGNGTNVLKIAPETAVRFFAFDWIKRQIAGNPGNITAAERFVAGALAGVISTCAIYPLEIAKTRLALSQSGQFRGIGDCLVSLARSEGVFAVYRGLGASLLGIVPYSGTELMTFSLLRDAYAARFPDTEPGVATLLSCGAVASMAGQVVAFPLQLARTRLQAQGLPGRDGAKYRGVVDCLTSVLKRDGPLGLYRGMMPGFLKSIPSCMISFAVFEQTRTFLNKVHKSKGRRS